MKPIKIFVLLLMIPLFNSCAQESGLGEVEFFIGTWKIEGRETYELWKKEGDKLVGESYKMKDAQKQVSETLEIKKNDDQIIYTATVLNQNQGKGIPFVLNAKNKEWFSFENMEHDFPNKIQYKILSETELQVNVLGKDGKGFSYKMKKQK